MALVAITHQALYPDGTPVPNSRLTLTPVQSGNVLGGLFLSSNGAEVSAPETWPDNGQGAFAFSVYPNTDFTDPNGYYLVQETGPNYNPAPWAARITAAGTLGSFRYNPSPTVILVHGAANHAGDIFPDGTEQGLGAGSLAIAQRDASGVPTPPAGTRMVFVDQADGHIKVKKSDASLLDLESGGGSGAPTTASYVTTAAEGGLSAEKVLGTDVVKRGAAASKAASPDFDGQIYIETDGSLIVWRGRGSGWDEYARGEAGIRLAQLAEKNASSLAGTITDAIHGTRGAGGHTDSHAAVSIGADGEHSLSGQVLSGVDASASQKGHMKTGNGLTASGGVVTADSSGETSAEVTTSETTTSASYTDLTTSGPSVTVTVGASGKCRVTVSCLAADDTAGAGALMSVQTDGAGTPSDQDSCGQDNVTANRSAISSRTTTYTGLSAGSHTFKAQYKRVTGGTATFARRRISATPI